jgi:uncharacterized membrane protein YphA (DoxX/SURF4 family)
VALAVLRVVIGSALFIQGGLSLVQSSPASTIWFCALETLAAGGLLLIGFLTPIAVGLTLLHAAAVALSLVPAPMPNLFESKLSLILGLTILLSIGGLGPGAFSLDARVFGRREIIIPPVE